MASARPPRSCSGGCGIESGVGVANRRETRVEFSAMRRWRLTAGSSMASIALTGALIGVLHGSALAQPADRPTDVVSEPDNTGARPPQRIGYGALPGGLHVAAAETLPAGTVELGLLSGFGYRKGLLSTDHTFDRAIGDIAIAYAPLANLAIALSF